MKSKYIALFVVGLVILSVSTYIVWPQAPTTPSSTTTDVTYEKTGAKTEFETIKGIEVPPEPDPELNNATLAGIDVNGNGVRDDVEREVARRFGMNTPLFVDATAFAIAEQRVMLENSSSSVATYVKAIRCGQLRSASTDPLTSLLLNTPQRQKTFRAALAGLVIGEKDCQ